MIFASVGTQKFQFDRLLQALDEYCETSSEGEDIFAQIGNSDYLPKFFSYERFLSPEEFDQKISACSLLITHGGVGTIVAGMKKGKPIIVCPRCAAYKEHVDDHQMQFAETFADMNYVILCDDIKNLGEAIRESKSHRFEQFHSGRDRINAVLESYLDSVQE